MHWLENHRDELELAFAEAARQIERLPAETSAPLLRYLELTHPLRREGPANYICYLLPYWLRRPFSLSLEDCRRMSAGNVLLMLHFFLLDDVIDAPGPDAKRQLAIAQPLSALGLSLYGPWLAAGTTLWSCWTAYTGQWSEGVTQENARDYFRTDRAAIANKAAPLKLSCAAAALAAAEPERIGSACEAVDRTLVSLQLCDDLADWREDLEEGSYNCLLSLIRMETGLPSEYRLTAAEVQSALTRRGLLDKYAAAAREQVERHEALGFDAPELLDYHRSLERSLSRAAEESRRQLDTMWRGGLSRLLQTVGMPPPGGAKQEGPG